MVDNRSLLVPRWRASVKLVQRLGGAGGLTLAKQHDGVGVRVLLAAGLQGRPGVGDMFAPAPAGVDYVGAIDAAWST